MTIAGTTRPLPAQIAGTYTDANGSTWIISSPRADGTFLITKDGTAIACESFDQAYRRWHELLQTSDPAQSAVMPDM